MDGGSNLDVLSVLRLIRLTRITRIFKMSKNFQGAPRVIPDQQQK